MVSGLFTGLLRRTGSTCSSRKRGPTYGTCVPTGSSTHFFNSAKESKLTLGVPSDEYVSCAAPALCIPTLIV